MSDDDGDSGKAQKEEIAATLAQPAFTHDAIEADAWIDTRHPRGPWHNGWDIASGLGAGLAHAAERVLNGIAGFFVDEPKLTPQQVHDTLQARGNVETLHAHDVALAAGENQAAHDWRVTAAIGAQQEHDLRLAQTVGTNATAEANLGLDEHEAERRSQSRSL